MKRFLFILSVAFAASIDRLFGRGLAYNAVMTPNECRDGVASLHGTAAIATKNYVVVRGADDQHFKIGSAVTDVPLGILLNDEIETDEVDVIKKSIALFGSYQGTLPGVAEAAIAVDALLTPGVGTFGRVKTLPTTVPGTYWVIGKSRLTVASAGDPVSIVHCVPFQVTIGDNSEIVTATNVITADESGRTFYLNNATGFVSTLPAPQLGLSFTFINTLANTSGNHTVVTGSSANIIKGNQNSVAGDAGDTGTADDTVNFVANASLAGDRLEVFSDGTSWFAYATSRVAAGMTFTTAS
jgi:hypothetical protein